MQKCYFMLLFYAQEFYLKNSFVKNEVYFDLLKILLNANLILHCY